MALGRRRPSLRAMRRILIALVLSLLALAMLVPAAQAKKRYSYFQDLSIDQGPGRIFLTVLYKDNHGNGKFTPRVADSYRFETPVSCATGSPGELSFSGNEFNNYGYFREPLRDGLFSHTFESQSEQPQTALLKGDVKGNVLTRAKRKNPQINGSIHVTDWTPSPGITGCMTTEFYSATPCKRWISPKAPKYRSWKKRKLPSASGPGSRLDRGDEVERHRVGRPRAGPHRVGDRAGMVGRRIAGGVDAVDPGAAVEVRLDRPARAELAAERGGEAFGCSRVVRTKRASRRSSGPDASSIRSSCPSCPTSRRIGSSRILTPAFSRAARSPLRPAGPSVRSTTSFDQPASTSADRAAAAPLPWTASGRSRTSQPSQNGQWKTDWPQRGSTPGSGGGS